ncbi:DUF2007 domain-containing protein [Pedobacter fastidiosus]|uniref:DUF2007 domain-containing protein n=1 Tax=Pedobacter fastidiosus TaxID=2765361 RepID=A0ABR7KTZ7_9SPHI|nr:DUF2007 domain-containing protein [Pedobacter fastidiosus]MBC6111584.1 DUF2007 domain-containing protein [Pedobacter fastidiosus]
MNDRTIIYSTYYNPIEANIIKARLEDSGFSCFLADENVSTIQPLYNQAIGGVKLIVFERDVDQINQLLAEDNSDLVDDGEETENHGGEKIRCEVCGSDNVGYGIAAQPKYSLWSTILAFITFSSPIHAGKCHHCYNCGHEFE